MFLKLCTLQTLINRHGARLSSHQAAAFFDVTMPVVDARSDRAD